MSDVEVSKEYKPITLAPFGPIGIISHTSNKEFVKRVSDNLSDRRKKRSQRPENIYSNTPGYCRDSYMFDSDLVRFQTGEGKFTIGESVRGHDIFVITDVLSHNMEIELADGSHVISPDDQYMDLLRILSTLKGKAKRVNVIMPFVYEGRREKLDSHRESYDCADMLKKLYELGVSNLIVFDPHDERIANAVPLMSIEMPRCQFKMTSTLLNKFGTLSLDKENTLVVSPDETGVSRAIFYASNLGLPLSLFYRKYTGRPGQDGRIFEYLGEDVTGKDILLIDDMINSGNTMFRTAEQLHAAGAKDIYCLAPFALFTNGLEEFDRKFEEGVFKCICTTNLIYAPEELQSREWYLAADMVPYVSRIIDALNADESVYDLINSTSRLQDLKSQMRIDELIDENDQSKPVNTNNQDEPIKE
ncbi:MAG: ribose-phosphate diphosphokinase [Clostridiales bacterium]|nr:ribose-phosphate diphosphokinase [Clostridiales bacterium]